MKKLLIIALTLTVAFSMTTMAFASSYTSTDEDTEDTVVIYAESGDDVSDVQDKVDTVVIYAESGDDVSDVQDKVDTAFENSDVDDVEVIYTDVVSSMGIEETVSLKTGKSAASPIYYYVKNVKRISDKKGSSDIAVATGGPRVTLCISKTKAVSTTYSATFGATKGAISGAVGWSITGSTSMSISGSAKVPAKHNGKKVKSMTLHAKTIYKVKTYDVHKYIPGYIYKKNGTGNTKKAYGVAFNRTYKYK